MLAWRNAHPKLVANLFLNILLLNQNPIEFHPFFFINEKLIKTWNTVDGYGMHAKVVSRSQNSMNFHVIEISSSSLFENGIVSQFDLNEFIFSNRIIFI